MIGRRVLVGALCSAVLVIPLVGPLASAGQLSPVLAQSTDGKTWLALGDSFSSGTGIEGRLLPDPGGLDCRRADGSRGPRAWAVRAFDDSREKFGLTGDRPTFVPCSGAITDDVFEFRAGRPVPQYLEATRVGKRAGKWDVVSFTFGGNNLKFTDVLIGCLNQFDDWTRADVTPGCNEDQATLEGRIDQLLGKPGATGADLQGSVNIPTLLDKVTDLVKPGGQVIVVGYPRLFVSSKLRSIFGIPDYPACAGVLGADTNMLNSVVDRLNSGLREAVEVAAEDRHEDKDFKFTFVDAADAIDGHELCSGKGSWINGRINTGADYISWYHPNQAGHDAIAEAVVAKVDIVSQSKAPPATSETVDVREIALAEARKMGVSSDTIGGSGDIYCFPSNLRKAGDSALCELRSSVADSAHVAVKLSSARRDDERVFIAGQVECNTLPGWASSLAALSPAFVCM